MNGLVGYGSSSEDEEDTSPTAVTTAAEPALSHPGADNSITVNGSSTDGHLPDVAETSSKPTQGPMVGPSKPAEAETANYEEDEVDEEVEDSIPTSERDMLRYLTQPSHPMTSLPPEPNEDADPAVTARFKRFLELKAKGIHFNEDLAGKTSFKNPALFASLLERTDLPPQAQYSSTLPSDIFHLDLFPDWAYKENLLKSQQAISAELDATKKSQSAAGKRTIEFTSASRSATGSRDSTPGNLTKRKRT